MSDRTTSTLLGLYDAALSDEHWPRALSQFSQEIDSLGAILVAVDQVGLPFQIEQATYPMEQVREYFEHHGSYDGTVFAARLATTQPLQLVRDRDVWGDISLLEDRDDYKWLRENIGASRRAGVRLSANKGWTDILALQFDREWDRTPAFFDERLGALLPHVAKAVEINRQFSILRARYHAALAALDHVRIGVCILTSTGQVVLANREARRIHDLDEGVRLSRGGRLNLASTAASKELTAMVHAVSLTAAGEGTAHEHIMLAERRSEGRPFLLELAPLRDSAGEIDTGLHGAIVFVVDPENHGRISIARLAPLYALTEAEAEVCRQMIAGATVPEIARTRAVSENTVKSQFKAIYAKTGVNKRVDLLRLAIAVDPPIG